MYCLLIILKMIKINVQKERKRKMTKLLKSKIFQKSNKTRVSPKPWKRKSKIEKSVHKNESTNFLLKYFILLLFSLNIFILNRIILDSIHLSIHLSSCNSNLKKREKDIEFHSQQKDDWFIFIVQVRGSYFFFF